MDNITLLKFGRAAVKGIDWHVVVFGGDYTYYGVIAGVVRKRRSGEWRAVVEDRNGRLFIHNARQIELRGSWRANMRIKELRRVRAIDRRLEAKAAKSTSKSRFRRQPKSTRKFARN